MISVRNVDCLRGGSNNGPEDQPAEGPVSPTGPASVATAVPPPAPPKNGLSALLEWSKPYREIIAILAAVIVSVSAGVAWIVAHFATQAELHYLECRIAGNVLTQLLPIHMEEFAEKIDWRSAQIKALAKEGTKKQNLSTIVDLTDQVNALTKDQKDMATKFQKDIDDIAKNCISETPQFGKAP